jgi:hypothetical protein
MLHGLLVGEVQVVGVPRERQPLSGHSMKTARNTVLVKDPNLEPRL